MTASPIIPAPYRMTWRDWLALSEDVRYRHDSVEIIAGELHMTPAPAVVHQVISGVLYRALCRHIADPGLGVVLYAPVGVRLSDADVLEPDILVVLEAHAGRIGEMGVEGPPDLVVEILSPGTAGRDLGVKRALYESHGVPEYWIVDPKAEAVEVLALGEEGAYVSAGRFGRGAEVASELVEGLVVAVDEVFGA